MRPGEDSLINSSYDVFDPTRVGIFTAGLTAGQTYTVSLANNANVAGDNGSTLHGAMNGQFNWHIEQQAVPEPGSAALAALALLALLATRRRA
ncbi:GC-motif protein sorting domain protein [Burkholderiales bacterium JOSHI_001]|nr:GC-motif protein sorting domain protein [Burkholderiales bacterium JOSHI_001]